MKVRTKARKQATPEIDPALVFVGSARTLPPVLTGSAVAKGLMPPLGVSALPASLEVAVPPAFRYWTAKSLDEAREVRDELVERTLILPTDLLKVDGEIRRVNWRAFLAVEDPEPAPLMKRQAVELAGAERLAFTEEAVTALDWTGKSVWTDPELVAARKAAEERLIVALADSPEARALIDGLPTGFALETRPGVVYGSTLPLDENASHAVVIKAVWSGAYINDLPDSAFLYISPGGTKDADGKTTPRSLRHFPVRDASGELDLPHLRNALARIPQSSVPQAAKDKAIAEAQRLLASTKAEKSVDVRLLRKADAPEERYVFGVVLEPDVIDSQNDTYSAEEVRKSAHRFMQDHAALGLQHSAIVTGKLKILESYIAPVDFAIGEETVKKGTWLLAIRVVDDALWTAVKAGSFTGFSIGGTAIREAT